MSKSPDDKRSFWTTIVGGRPPETGKESGGGFHGIEILLKKASVDPAFKSHLLEKRSDAAKEIELDLHPAESAMLNSVPPEHLESIISRTRVPKSLRKVFRTGAVAMMLAALTLGSGCQGDDGSDSGPIRGVMPDRPDRRGFNQEQEYPILTSSCCGKHYSVIRG